MNKINSLIVKFNHQEVGTLGLEGNQVVFQYAPTWLKNGFSISPLKLPLSDKVYIFQQTPTKDIWGVFADSLPDYWGQRLCTIELAKRGIAYDKLNILEKLSLNNEYNLGALRYYPINQLTIAQEIDIDKIALDIMDSYYDLESIKDIDALFCLGGSTGGARPKIYQRDKEGVWIVKFPISREDINSGVQEYEANITARECDICTNEFKLIPSSVCKGFFAAKRFDIDQDNQYIHMITIAGLLDIDFKNVAMDYKLIFEIIIAISANCEVDLYEFFRRMVFNYLYGNKDDHCKNTAFIYDSNLKGYRLSPSYDTTKTPLMLHHSIICNGKEEPTIDDFLEIAKRNKLNLNKCREIIDDITRVINSQK